MSISEIPTADLLAEIERRKIPADVSPAIFTVTEIVAQVFGVSVSNIFLDTRLEGMAQARFAVWLILREQGVNSSEMAVAFAKRDTGTIRLGLRRGMELVDSSPNFSRKLKAAMDLINQSKA